MLKNQVAFMEKLLLRQKDMVENSSTASLTRDKSSGSSLSGSKLGLMAMSLMIFAITFIPETEASGGSINQRILLETSSGFSLFNPKSASAFILSLARLSMLSVVVYMLFLFVFGLIKKINRPSDEDYLNELLSTSKKD